jgi:hypothetical protein
MKGFWRQGGGSPDWLGLIESGDLEGIRAAARRDPEGLGRPSPQGMYPLLLAAFRGDNRMLAELLALGARPQQILGQPNPLLVAVLEGNAEGAKLLLEAGAPPDLPDGFGATALLYAARGGHAALIRLLAAHGADLGQRDAEGDTALAYAAAAGQAASVELLLALGADPRSRNFDGLSPADRCRDPQLRRLLED